MEHNYSEHSLRWACVIDTRPLRSLRRRPPSRPPLMGDKRTLFANGWILRCPTFGAMDSLSRLAIIIWAK